MGLSKWTIEALVYKAVVALDELTFDDADQTWQGVAEACEEAIKSGCLNKTAMDELEDYTTPLEGEPESRAELRAIRADLCRAGYYEVYDTEVISTGRRRKMTVDGVTYEV